MIDTLLAAKLYMASPVVGSIERSRLVGRLNEGIRLGRKVTLISAPPGYGKTTLVAGWLSGVGRPYAWVSLDEGDNDPVRFFTYVIAALRSIRGEIGASLEGLLQSSILPSAEHLVTVLVNDITSGECPFILVLDDYHVLRNSFIHDVIQQMINHLPPIFNLVLVTREDPPMCLSKWRVRGQLAELRAVDLKFNLDETTAFFSDKAELNLNDEEITTLVNRTEGWIAGLRLAAISIRGLNPDQVRRFIKDFDGNHRYVIDYLMEEVLKQQEVTVRNFLCRTAILDMLNAPLCDAVIDRSDSKAMLKKLEQANLFLIPLDEYRVWFRYHHLFADFLRTQILDAERVDLHKRAAAWYEANGYSDDAFKHVLAAGDTYEASSMILRMACRMIEKGQLRTLLSWIEAIPVQVVHNDDELFGYKAYALFLTGQVDEAVSLVGSANIAVGPISSDSQARLLVIKAWLALARGDLETLKLAEEALNLIGDCNPLLRMLLLITLGQIQRSIGIPDSSRTFREVITLAQKNGSPLHGHGALMELVFNLYIQGSLKEAINLCRQALAETEKHRKLVPYTGIFFIYLGVFYYEINRLDSSKDFLLKGLESINLLRLARVTIGDQERFLARVLYVIGEKEAALSLLRKAREETDQSVLSLSAFRINAQEAEFMLREGNLKFAARWAEEAGLSPGDSVNFQREDSYFVYVRIMMAQKLYNDARLLLKTLDSSAREGERYGRLITICILRALVGLRVSGIEDALPYFEEAVKLAAPEGYCRAFLDEGEDVAILLREVRDISPVFVNDLLTAFNDCRTEKSAAYKRQQTAIPGTGYIEPLSERELEIIKLMAAGLSNADIARKLHLTVGTVKWHATNIYSKLKVKTRTQAASEARKLELLV
jgi:LuxR family maltose regulon positive regulatory protein